MMITSNSRGAVDRDFVYIELETSFSSFFSFFVLFFCLSLFLPSFWCLLCHSFEERQLWCSLVWPTEEFCTPHCLTPLILLSSLFIYFLSLQLSLLLWLVNTQPAPPCRGDLVRDERNPVTWLLPTHTFFERRAGSGAAGDRKIIDVYQPVVSRRRDRFWGPRGDFLVYTKHRIQA